MELGNIIFGNSRGSFHVDRNLQDGFYNHLESMGFDGYGNNPSKDDWVFENDIFRMQPYYWGDCSCDYEFLEEKFHKENTHDESCYFFRLKAEQIATGIHWTSDSLMDYNEKQKIKDSIYKDLTKEYNLPMQGCAVHCTCYKDADSEKWYSENHHKDGCFIDTPNFTFKPTGFTLNWYKYPLRDSYSSSELTKELMDEMMYICRGSL